MKSKLFLFPIFIILSVLLASNVSAIVVYGDWESGSQSIQIDQGESINFNADFFSTTLPMTINIKLYDSDYALVHSFESDKVVNTYGYYNVYTITENIYNTAGNFEIILTGSDGFGEMTHILYLDVINYPPEITSTPITEVNEGESYNYLVVAEDPDNHTLSYFLSVAPEWLSINSGSGLITGTAPDVSEDTDFDVSVVVSDGIDIATQSYTLKIIWIPKPSLTQTVELVENDVKVEYNAVLYELNSAILEIYYKELGSPEPDYELIETRNINTPSYNELFNFYEIPGHEKTKGDYRFVLEAVGYDLSETDGINIPDYAPEVDLSSVSANFNEEDSIEITLPVPTDKNPEDEPVAYLSASSSKTTADINGYILTLEGNRDETGAYSVELEFGDPNGAKATTILSGYIDNLPDISGVLENNEEDLGEQGVIRVYYQDPDNSSNYLLLEIDKIYEGSIINASLGKIQTTSDGIFNFQINKKESELEIIVLQARIGAPENYTGYVRTIELSGDDNLGVLVRAVPYSGLNENGISVEDFRRHAQEVLTKEDNPPENANPWIFKWNFGENLNSSSLFEEVIISKQNPYEPGVFPISQYTAEVLKGRILNSSDIGSGFDGKINNTIQVRIEDSWIFEEPRDYGRIIIYPSAEHNNAFARDITRNGYIDVAIINLITNSDGNFSGSGSAPAHEIFHITEMYGHTQIFNSTQSIMGAVAVPGVPITPRFADMKLAKAIYENSYQHGIGMENWLRLESILGLGFYGESQITGTFSEYYSSEPEEDEEENFTGGQQNSREDDIIGSYDEYSNVNTNTPYDGTIYLQSNENEKNILTSLSDIIRQVISFISQKLRSIF